MEVFRSIQQYEAGRNPAATIGTFDGVHPGHLKILGRAKDIACEIDGETVVITFHPHPRRVLYPDDNDLRLLQTLDEKIDRLAQFGIDKLLIIPFTLEFSRLTADQFVAEVLLGAVNARKVCIGYDHRFGRNRAGGYKELERIAQSKGFEVEEIPAHQIDDANVSSTKIRMALQAGDISLANKYLNYEYPLTGTVVKGDQRGRTIGFPTANLEVTDELKLTPGIGVYAVRAKIEGKEFPAMMNIGVRPTVDGQTLTKEVHLIDFGGDLYGQNLTVSFVKKLRDEQRFSSLEALKNQLAQDRIDAIDTFN